MAEERRPFMKILLLLLSLSFFSFGQRTQDLIRKVEQLQDEVYTKQHRLSPRQVQQAYDLVNNALKVVRSQGHGGGDYGSIRPEDLKCLRSGTSYVLAYQSHNFDYIQITGTSFTFQSNCEEVVESKHVVRNNYMAFCNRDSSIGSYFIYSLDLRRKYIEKGQTSFVFSSSCEEALGISQ